jgi:predicted Zn-dependent protease
LSTERLRALTETADADNLVRYIAAERLASSGDGEKAWVLADKALTGLAADDNSDQANRIRTTAALLCAEFGTVSRAEVLLDSLKKSQINNPSLQLIQGELAARQGDMRAAYLDFHSAAIKRPEHSDAWRRAGRAALSCDLFPEAIEAYEHAVSLNPSDAHLHASLADALGKAERFQEAYSESLEAARLAPENSRFTVLPAINRAIAARSEEEYVNADKMLQAQIAKQPANGPLLAMLAGLQMRFNRLTDARKTQQMYLVRAPRDFAAWLDLEEMCRRQADERAAKAAHTRFQMIIDADDATHELVMQALLHPDDPSIWLKLSTTLHKAGKNRRAYYALEKAAQLDPANQNLSMMVSRVRAMMNIPDQGSDFDNAIRGTNLQ